MPKISADYNRILSAAGEFSSQSERIKQLRTEIQNIMKQIPLETTYFTAAKTRMMLQCMNINTIGNKYKRIGSALEEIENTYKDADNRALNGDSIAGLSDDRAWSEIIKAIHTIFPDDILWNDKLADILRRGADVAINQLFRTWTIPYTSAGANAIRNFLVPSYGIAAAGVAFPVLALTRFIMTPKKFSGGIEPFTVKDEGFKLLNKFKGSPEGPFRNSNEATEERLKSSGDLYKNGYNSDTKKQGLDTDAAKEKYSEEQLKNMKDANKFMKREVSMELAGQSKEVSVLSANGSVSNEFGSIEGEVKALKAEAHAGAGLGEYSYKSSDGKIHHGVGAYAEVGASASVLETEVKGRLGNENLGVYGKADGKVLSAGATGSVNVGMVDGKVQAYVGGKAEAVLVEGSVSGGVSVGGIDVGAKATGKVGFSASANAGIKDGHLVIDAGLAVGVGGEVSLDIDISKPAEVIKNAGEAVYGAAHGAKEFFGNLFR